MRRSVTALLLLLVAAPPARGEEQVCPFDMADVEVTYQAALPGLDYAAFQAPRSNRHEPSFKVHVVRVSLLAPFTVRVLRLREKAMRVEQLVTAATKAGRTVLAAINGDYFSAFQEGKSPHGLHVSGGRMLHPPTGTTSLALSASGAAQMATPELQATVQIGGRNLPIDVFHRPTPKHGIGLYFGSFVEEIEPHNRCRAIIFGATGTSYVDVAVAAPVLRTLNKVKKTPLAPDEAALVICTKEPASLPEPGEKLNLHLALSDLDGPLLEALSGGPRILRAGKRVFEGKTEGFPLWQRGYLSRTHPRTALGLGIGGSTLYLLVAEGRPGGLDAYGTSCVLQGLGAVDAMLLDGGGSSVMMWQDRIVNRPHAEKQRTSRRVANALAIVPRPADEETRADSGASQ